MFNHLSATSIKASDILNHVDPYEQQSSTDHIDIYSDYLNDVESSTDSIITTYNIEGVNFVDFLNDDDDEEQDDFKFDDFLRDDDDLFEDNEEKNVEDRNVVDTVYSWYNPTEVEVQLEEQVVVVARTDVEEEGVEKELELRVEEERKAEVQVEKVPRTRKRKFRSEAEASTPTTPKTKRNKKTTSKKIYSCPYLHCSLTTDRKHNMKMHLETHDENRVKAFPCERCDKRFSRKYDMNRHMNKQH